MKPELPIEMPDREKIIPVVNMPEMECAMIRCSVRCNNLTTSAWLYPALYGAYTPTAICRMCLEEMSHDW